MHLFLTGEIQIGKTTVVARTLALLNSRYGGFKTYFGPDRESEDRCLYLNSAVAPDNYSTESRVVQFRKDTRPLVLTEKFNSTGVELIRTARENADLIIMDECGNFEQTALDFQRELITTLDQNKPVLGVLKLASSGWTDLIRNHPKVKIITVASQNRNELPKILAQHFLNRQLI
ncbi:MAG: nucleotide kinase [Acetobacterium woodii]|nr:nucleotide kinase [Acetobacterium woodii]